MSFENPDLLYFGAAVALVVAVGLWSHARRRRRFAEFLGGRRAVARLSSWNLYRWRIERIILVGGSALLLAVAAAGPMWLAPAVEPPPPPPVQSVVLAIDVSASMQATDEEPNRLARAVEIAREVVATLPEARIGLLIFAGKAYPLAPPTHDHRVIRYLLDGVTPATASAYDPGSLLSVGLTAAVEQLAGSGEEGGDRSIVLISDGEAGEANTAVSRAVDSAIDAGIRVHAIAVGTERGAGMVMPRGEYQLGGPVTSPSGAPAVSRLRPQLLRQAAERTSGAYVLATDPVQVSGFLRSLRQPLPDRPPEIVPPRWADYDLTFWLVVGALLGLLLDGLLDATLPRLAPGLRRRTA